MKQTLKQLSRFAYLPDFTISSGFRINSERHKDFSAVDLVFNYPKNLNQYQTDLIFAKYFNQYWNGGLGINFSDCRHFHIDLKPDRSRWLEQSRPGSGTCSERLETKPLPNLGKLNENDLKFLSKNFLNREPMVTFKGQTEKFSSFLVRSPNENNVLASLLNPGFFVLIGFLSLLYFKERK